MLKSFRREALLSREGALTLAATLISAILGVVLGRYELITFSAITSFILAVDAVTHALRINGTVAAVKVLTYPSRIVLGSSGRVACMAWIERGGKVVNAPLELRDAIPSDAEVVSGSAVGRGEGTAFINYLVKPVYRGRYVLGPLTVTSSSPLSLVVIRYHIPGTERAFDAVPTFYAESLRTVTPKIRYPNPGSHQVMLKGGSGDFIELREYVPGDDVRLIHWPSTARSVKGVPLIRDLLVESSRTVFLVVDPYIQTALEYVRGRRLIDDLVDAAGGITYLAMRFRDPIGFFIASNPSLTLPPTTRRDYIHSALKFLEGIQPTSDRRMIWLRDVLVRYVGRGSLILILSTLHSLSINELKDLLKLLKAMELRAVFIIPDIIEYVRVKVPEDIVRVVEDKVREEELRVGRAVKAILGWGSEAAVAGPETIKSVTIHAYLSMRGLIHAVKH